MYVSKILTVDLQPNENVYTVYTTTRVDHGFQDLNGKEMQSIIFAS